MREVDRLLAEADADEDVLGVILGGSRGKRALVDDDSDWDVYVVVRDDADAEAWRTRWPSQHGDEVEVFVQTLAAFRDYALPATPDRWNAYTFAHVEPLLDKLDGEIARLAAEKARADPATAAQAVDTYINAYYRSYKNARRGWGIAAQLDAAESIAPFLEFVFAVRGRVRPFNKFLEWELREHPLGDPWSPESLPRRLARIAATGDLAEQAALFRDAEEEARRRGLSDVVDGWEPDVAPLRGG